MSLPEEGSDYPAAHLCPLAQAGQADLLPLYRKPSIGRFQGFMCKRLAHSRQRVYLGSKVPYLPVN